MRTSAFMVTSACISASESNLKGIAIVPLDVPLKTSTIKAEVETGTATPETDFNSAENEPSTWITFPSDPSEKRDKLKRSMLNISSDRP